jgi:hypothetical protein
MKASEADSTRKKRWVDLIRQQGQSKLSMTAFCPEHGVSDQSFYNWRKRLPGNGPVRFALVDAKAPVTKDSLPVELILASGDCLRIATGADAATLRTVLNFLREPCMMHLPASVRVYLCASACDMRKSFNGFNTSIRQSSNDATIFQDQERRAQDRKRNRVLAQAPRVGTASHPRGDCSLGEPTPQESPHRRFYQPVSFSISRLKL